MSLFESASLVVTPNGKKASKLYAIKPTDGSGDLTVTRATTATRVNSAGLIESVAVNVPRLDYTDSTCPSILVEPQRTNLVLNSATVATQTIASLAQVYTLSFYGTGTITLSGTHTATVVGLGTERKTYTFTAIVGALVLTVSGTCTNGQLEASSYATSYIPTTSASVTRNADVISKTGISSLIGTEFTLFYDGYETIGGDFTRYLILKGTGGTYENLIILETSSSNRISVTVKNSAGGNVFFAVSNSLTNGQRVKIGIRCKNNDFAFYVNGVELGTQLSGTVPTTSDLYLGYYTDYADNYTKVNSCAIWKTGLSNEELASITTL
jgi:hypothetical protein